MDLNQQVFLRWIQAIFSIFISILKIYLKLKQWWKKKRILPKERQVTLFYL